MSKLRVHELAKELGISSKEAVAKLQELGEFVKSASSTIEAPAARKLREAIPAKPAAAAEEKPVKKTAKKAAEFIKNAPLPRAARPAYRILFWAAVDLLPPNYARMIDVRIPPRWLVRFLATAAVGAMRAIIGRTSPLEDAAVRRRQRLEHRKVG